MQLLGSVQPEVDRRLLAFLEQELSRAGQLGAEARAMVRALSDLCRRGGKRLRPALAAVGFRAVNDRAKLEAVFEAGVALELLQAYFLIHDDWMDKDAVRRGGPTAHVQLSEHFDDAHLGAASAILAGDYAAALALSQLTRLRVPEARLRPALAAFADMQAAAVLGQQLDLIGVAKDVEAAYTLKTGSYTVFGPLKLGAVLAGAGRRTLTTLARVSAPLGIGFQLRDDLLSAFGDPLVTGKPLGNDLRAGKRTVLLLEAKRRARGADRTLLSRVVGDPRAKPAELRQALGVLEATGARAAVEARILELSQRSLDAIAGGLTPLGAELLTGAVHALTERRA